MKRSGDENVCGSSAQRITNNRKEINVRNIPGVQTVARI